MGRLFTLAALAVLTAETFLAQTSYQTIHSFGKLPDGGQPHASLVIGPQGSLFGTTFVGGEHGDGTVFELANPTGAAWTEILLYSFANDPDGKFPQANVVFGPGGALYGTTEGGGSGGGTVFQLSQPSVPGDAWIESVLYSFSSDIHATVNAPLGAVLFDNSGTLYTTARGQTVSASGGVVALAPPAAPGGSWAESTIYKFSSDGTATSGSAPYAGLVIKGGSLYGTDHYNGDPFGCIDGCGAVYEVTPPASPGGGWTVTVIYDFVGPPNDGSYSSAPLTVGPGGSLYGTTLLGGLGMQCGDFSPGCGTVFQLTPPTTPGSAWTESVLYSFTGVNGDGAYPMAPVVIGQQGRLYGTTQYGGDSQSPCSFDGGAGCGIVFELSPPATPGAWTETILHSFTGQGGDGAIPAASLVMGPSGVLYGTTSSGGANGKGTVFAIKP